MNRQKNILVVGAGFAGAVVARELAEQDYFVDLIDAREHIGGNCYDEIDKTTGIRIHKYGPHIFHTNDQGIYEYVSRFTQWINYRHKVQAYVEGVGFLPFPINIDTINGLYNEHLNSQEDMECFLNKIKTHHKQADNARLYAENIYGKELVELFFSRYTRKMWAIELDQLPASVIARLPIRYDKRDEYFNDRFQAMPEEGYATLFNNLLTHKNIHVQLGTCFDSVMEKNYLHVFNSMSIDEYYKNEFGPLEYRSIKYQTDLKNNHCQPVPTVNLTDTSPVTRFTDWRLYPGCYTETGDLSHLPALVTKELPCSYKDNNNERYYPVKTVDGIIQKRYKKYQELAQKNKKSTFIGRCGQYRYLDMHQVVANSLQIARNFISGNQSE